MLGPITNAKLGFYLLKNKVLWERSIYIYLVHTIRKSVRKKETYFFEIYSTKKAVLS